MSSWCAHILFGSLVVSSGPFINVQSSSIAMSATWIFSTPRILPANVISRRPLILEPISTSCMQTYRRRGNKTLPGTTSGCYLRRSLSIRRYRDCWMTVMQSKVITFNSCPDLYILLLSLFCTILLSFVILNLSKKLKILISTKPYWQFWNTDVIQRINCVDKLGFALKIWKE